MLIDALIDGPPVPNSRPIELPTNRRYGPAGSREAPAPGSCTGTVAVLIWKTKLPVTLIDGPKGCAGRVMANSPARPAGRIRSEPVSVRGPIGSGSTNVTG